LDTDLFLAGRREEEKREPKLAKMEEQHQEFEEMEGERLRASEDIAKLANQIHNLEGTIKREREDRERERQARARERAAFEERQHRGQEKNILDTEGPRPPSVTIEYITMQATLGATRRRG